MTSPYGEPLDTAEALRRRAGVFRRLRVAALALVVGYFFLPYDIQAWIPVWLPFALALGLEADFFIGGYLLTRRGQSHPSGRPDRGPQPRDLAELGGDPWGEAEALDDTGEEPLGPAAPPADDPREAPSPEPEARLGRRARHPYVRRLPETVAAVAAVAGILFYASRPHGWSAVSTANQVRAEGVFSREASRIAGHPARVLCDTGGRHVGVVQDADGVAEVGGKRAYLTPGLCDTLYQLAFKDRVQSFAGTARALAVLAHESWHLQGVADEGLANCYGFQSGVHIGVDLGLSEQSARSMMRAQLADNASDSAGDSRYLVPPECRNDGADDLSPESSRFP